MAIEGDAIDSIITVADDASLDITGDIVLMAWIFKNSVSGSDCILTKGPLSASDITYYFYTFGDEILLGFRSGGVFHEIVTDTADIPIDTWVNVAVVHNTVADTITFYLNGVVESATVSLGTPLTSARIANSGSLFLLENGAGVEEFDGILEDVRIYNRVLSTAEIQSIVAKHGSDADGPGLAAKWRMNESAPGTTASGVDTVRDVSGNGNHGTPTLGPVYRDSNLHFRKRAS